MNTAVEAPPKPTTPLRIPAFRRFVLAGLISATGSAMAPLALAYAVIDEGGGAGSLGVVLTTNTLPTIAFLLIGGVLADRVPRSTLLFLGNLLAGAAQGVLAVVVAAGHASTASIAACGFASGIASAFISPAAQGVPAQIVAPEQLQAANALIRLPTNTVKVLGPVVGGLLVVLSGPAWALGWDALTFVAAAVLLRGLRLSAPVVATSALSALRAGWSGFRTRVWLWTYTAGGTVVVAAWLAGYQLLGPLVAAEHYAGARSWGLVQGAFALGLLAGTVVCLRWRPYRMVVVSLASSVPLSLPLAAMAWDLPLPCVLAATLLAGIALDIGIVSWTTAFQQHVPGAEQGRLSALHEVGERLAIPVGYLVTSLAVRSWQNTTVLLLCAGVILVTTVVNLCVRDVYRVNRL